MNNKSNKKKLVGQSERAVSLLCLTARLVWLKEIPSARTNSIVAKRASGAPIRNYGQYLMQSLVKNLGIRSKFQFESETAVFPLLTAGLVELPAIPS